MLSKWHFTVAVKNQKTCKVWLLLLCNFIIKAHRDIHKLKIPMQFLVNVMRGVVSVRHTVFHPSTHLSRVTTALPGMDTSEMRLERRVGMWNIRRK